MGKHWCLHVFDFPTMSRAVLIHTLLLLAEASVPRGGSVIASRPEFLELDRSSLQACLDLAKDRHSAAIKAAEAAYWSGGAICSDESEPSTEIDAIQVETHTLVPPSTWSLPDFAAEFQNEIKVTRGAAHGGNDATPLFTPEECQEVIEAAEAHFEGKSWTTLPSGQYDVSG